MDVLLTPENGCSEESLPHTAAVRYLRADESFSLRHEHADNPILGRLMADFHDEAHTTRPSVIPNAWRAGLQPARQG